MSNNFNTMYSKLPNLILGFHGCDMSTLEKVLYQHSPLIKSDNTYDWLGNGIYFWENSYERAYDWAKRNSKYKKPAVIGAVLDLGYCLNLTDYDSSQTILKGWEMLKLKCQLLNIDMPRNSRKNKNNDILLRDLDCAVIQQIHEYHHNFNLRPYDSVRGVFIEGKEIYPDSGFMEKTHIQICVTNPNCIKGYFNPIKYDESFEMP